MSPDAFFNPYYYRFKYFTQESRDTNFPSTASSSTNLHFFTNVFIVVTAVSLAPRDKQILLDGKRQVQLLLSFLLSGSLHLNNLSARAAHALLINNISLSESYLLEQKIRKYRAPGFHWSPSARLPNSLSHRGR